VILPKRNGPELDDLPEVVREAMKFHLAESVADVLTVALDSTNGESSAQDRALDAA
jgi:ATP-dependent Lon protease